MLEMSKFCIIKPKASWSQLLATSLRQILFYAHLRLFVLQKLTANLMKIHKAANIPI